VKGLKFHGATAIAESMAALIVVAAPEAVLGAHPAGTAAPGAEAAPWPEAAPAGTAALVPVPLHPGRRRSRGFNQAELLAAAIGRRTGLPRGDCLARSGPNGRQVGRGRAARLTGPAGSIEVVGEVPSEAILVDDVVTTGGTLAACAAALRAAGSQRVVAVAFARTAGR
jgi:predicted amidophosphoribosyltransferase